VVACGANLRLFQSDSSYISFSDIYDLHCEKLGISREEPILVSGEKLKIVLSDLRAPPAGRQVSELVVCVSFD
jgi:transformation/transcription domain-associated protein